MTQVRLRMLPSFVLARLPAVAVPGYGPVDVVVAYGGIFHAIVGAASLGLPLLADSAGRIAQAGIAIRRAVNAAFDAVHPGNAKIRGIANVVVAGGIARGADGAITTTNATVIGNGRLDRSPTGTGVAARTALLVEDDLVAVGEEVTHRSVFGTSFLGKAIETVDVGANRGVICEVAGQAWITGFSEVLVDPGDPLAHGHCPNDLWLTQQGGLWRVFR